MSERNDEIERAERFRRQLVDEMMQRPFGDRVMSDSQEVDLQAVEHFLLTHPPMLPNGEVMGTGLLPEGEDETVADPFDPFGLDAAGIQVIPESQWPAYIAGQNGEQQLHVEPYVKGILNQGSVGSCASDALAGATMTSQVASGLPYVELNGYFAYNTVSGGSDQGSSLSANINFFSQYGCASAAVWPRSQGWRTTPSQAAREDALQYSILKPMRVRNWTEFGTMLLHPYAVYFGYSGHAIYGSRLIAPNRCRYANSWSPSWGDRGFGTIASSSIMWSYGAWCLISVSDRR